MLQLQTKTGCAPKTQFILDGRHLKMVSVIMTRDAPHWRRKVGQQEVCRQRPSHFSSFHFQFKRSQYAPQITKALWLPNLKRGSGSEFKAPHDPTPESDNGWEQEEAPKPGFFLQKKSKLCLLLLSQFQRILKPGLLLEAQWSPPGVRGRPGTVAFPVTTHPS